MTIIAWDGKSLAVDKMGCDSSLGRTVTKHKKLSTGEIALWTGAHGEGLILADWYENGCKIKDWPKFQTENSYTNLIIISESKIIEYERHPIAITFEDNFQAWGSGRDYALGAMAMGATAEKAVEIAINFNVYCGNGVEVFHLKN